MKTFLAMSCLSWMLLSQSYAATGYISDILVVTVRDQASNSGAVLTTVQTGTPLEIIKELKSFTHVRTEKGVEGYVRSQYISRATPKEAQIRELNTTNKQLLQQVDELTARLDESKVRSKNLSATEEELALVREEYQKLQQTSSAVLQITRERDQFQQENIELTEHMQQLKEENNLYLRTGVIKWFLAGAGVLLLGWFLGKISRKKKRNYM